jgi:hypothetical protein
MRELEKLIKENGVFVYDPPIWAQSTFEDRDAAARADFYIMVGDDICLPVERASALTLLTRGTFSPERRENRNRIRRERRQARSARRQNESWRGEKNPRWR